LTLLLADQDLSSLGEIHSVEKVTDPIANHLQLSMVVAEAEGSQVLDGTSAPAHGGFTVNGPGRVVFAQVGNVDLGSPVPIEVHQGNVEKPVHLLTVEGPDGFQSLALSAIHGDLVHRDRSDLVFPIPVHVPEVHAHDARGDGLASPEASLSEGSLGSDFDKIRVEIRDLVSREHGFGNQELGVPQAGKFPVLAPSGIRALLPGAGEDLGVDVLGELVDLGNHLVQGLGLGIEIKGLGFPGNRSHFGVDADRLPQGGDAPKKNIVGLQVPADAKGLLQGKVRLGAGQRLGHGRSVQNLHLSLPGESRGQHVANPALKVGQLRGSMHGKGKDGHLGGNTGRFGAPAGSGKQDGKTKD